MARIWNKPRTITSSLRGRRKVLVLMSGGVDSSTAAVLLQKKGYDVSGVYLKLWDSGVRPRKRGLTPHIGDSCWAREMQDAARVAAKLNIPFQVWDVTKEYKKRVLKNFYSEYAAGRTPNPDVLCNSEIKFGIALDKALTESYDFVATGHYARVVLRDTCYVIRVGVDKNKDQSYFLWRLTQKQLAHIIFPIGNYTKPQVRKMAKKFGLHNADKKDSQGVCFLGKIELKRFLTGVVKMKPGPIIDVSRGIIGEHDGLAQFTIGQRHGGNIKDGKGPYFVIAKDIKENVLIVANKQEQLKYRAIGCTIKEVNLLGLMPKKLKARIRYRGELFAVSKKKNSVQFKIPQQAVAEGQSIVFYDRDKVVGGGVIDKVFLMQKLRTN